LIARRGLLRGQLLAGTGKADEALAVLSAVPGLESVQLQAQIMEGRRRWAGAAGVLNTFLQTAPAAASRDVILRLARDESEAGDIAGLQRLRAEQGRRFVSGPGAELFAVLTEAPVRAVADLPRAGKELAAMHALPAALAPGR
jgi:hypothetical protein